VLGFDHRQSSSCRICGQSQDPEALFPLEVPLFAQSHQVCAGCRADYRSSGRVLSELQAPVPPSRPFPWPGPLAGDVEVVGEASQAALRAHLEVRATRQPSPEGDLDPPQLEALVSAWQSWDDSLPYYESTSAEHALGVILFSLLTLELGSRAPKLYGRRGGPAEWLKGLADQARNQPALRDPRLPWLRAVLALEAGNLAGVDRDLALALEWVRERGEAERWSEVAAGLHYARALRARARSLWGAERDALKEYCRAAPSDELGFLELARAQVRCSRPEVAREILAARVGSAAATPAAVAREVRDQLGELRPRLQELHAERSQASSALSPALSYAACLVVLGEHDEAWRVLSGSEWLAQIEPSGWTPEEAQDPRGAEPEDPEPCDLDPSARPYLELSARAALGRGQREGALKLLQAAHDLAKRSGEDEPRVRRDLLAVLQEEACERLDDLEEATRSDAAALASAGPEDPDERREIERSLHERLLGGGEGPASGEGLRALHALLRRHRVPLALEFREPIARRALDWFLGRELANRFAPLVEPPSPLDSGQVRLADDRYRTHLAYRALARRQLAEALGHDQRARDAVGFGSPIRPLLTYLELVRRGGPSLAAWATGRWLRTLGQEGRGQIPFEVGLLPVQDDELEECDLRRFALLLAVEDPDRPAEWPALGRLAGRCQLLFPSEGALEGLPKVPRVRAYVQRLLAEHPGLALLLDWGSGSGMFRLVLGCLASPDALTLDGLNVSDESVLASLATLLDGLRDAAASLDLDPGPPLAALLENLPPELRARFKSD
jgi:hypothetical protein